MNPLAIASVATRLVATVLVVVMLARLYRSRVGIWAIVLLSITFSPVLFSVAFQLFAKVTRRPEVDWRPDGLLGRDVWQLWISVAVLLSIVVLDRILARFMRTEERLRDSEDRLRSMITAVPDTILIFDVDGTIRFANLPIQGTSQPRIIGGTVFQLVDPAHHTALRQAISSVIETHKPVRIELRAPRNDGTLGWFSVRMGPLRQSEQPLCITSISTDVTSQKQAEEALRRSERLASIGTFATGIAHEINNPLGAILLSAQTALRRIENYDRSLVRNRLEEIVQQSKRCGRIAKSLLQFARHEPSEKWSSDLNDVVRHAVEVTRPYTQQQQGIVKLQLREGLPRLAMNPMEIEQVVINLLRNALQSGADRPEVNIATNFVPGRIRLTIRDNGDGVPGDEQHRIFDPFYTTRRRQGGTGLGLSLADSIIRDHGGKILANNLTDHHGVELVIEIPFEPTHKAEPNP